MIIMFKVKIDEYAGVIYERPILNVSGQFEGETELEEFVEQLSKDIREKVNNYLKKRRNWNETC